MACQPLTLVNILKVDPERQAALIERLEANVRTVVSTLDGWIGSRLVASGDGRAVIIVSQWENEAALGAMREDPRMKAWFPQLLALATFESVAGRDVFALDARAGR